MNRNYDKGQTLIEVLAALSVATVLMFGIAIAVIYSLDTTQFTKNENSANSYAQEGMEITKQIWNSNISYFDSLSQTQGNYFCLDKDSSNLVEKTEPGNTPPDGMGCNGDNLAPFAREVDLYADPADDECALEGIPQAIKVVVTVSWSDGKCMNKNNLYCHSVQLNSCLSKSIPLTAP